jgi:outer membrane biosynthesis protein TonB
MARAPEAMTWFTQTRTLLAAVRIASAEKPPTHVNVSPQTLEGLRTAGERIIEPDAETRRRIEADHARIVNANYVVCIDTSGAVVRTELLKSSHYPEWDERIRSTIVKTWRFRPYKSSEDPRSACAAITQTYTNPKAPPAGRPGQSA